MRHGFDQCGGLIHGNLGIHIAINKEDKDQKKGKQDVLHAEHKHQKGHG